MVSSRVQAPLEKPRSKIPTMKKANLYRWLDRNECFCGSLTITQTTLLNTARKKNWKCTVLRLLQSLGLNVRKQKNLQSIEFSNPLLNHPNSTGLLGSCVNTTASIYILFNWHEKTFAEG